MSTEIIVFIIGTSRFVLLSMIYDILLLSITTTDPPVS